MNRFLFSLLCIGTSCCAMHCAPPVASAITIDWVTVGDPGNVANPVDGDVSMPGVQTFGAVDHSYLIGKYAVTWSQYVAFLNSNDPTGENLLGIYDKVFSSPIYDGGIDYDPAAKNGAKYSVMTGRDNRPANYVDFFQAVRFANWLNNNQVPGSTETGAYTLLGNSVIPTNGDTFTRNADAKVFLPSEDEWYKAAFYNPVTKAYYLYPTSSDTVPTGSAPTSTPNSANFYPNGPYTLTDVGSYSGTTSPYGAFDMGGNVWQWNETSIIETHRGVRGGSFINTFEFLRSSTRGHTFPYHNIDGFGFRVAAVVPEPSTGLMAAIAAGMLCLVCGRIRRSKRNCGVLLSALAVCGAMFSAPAAAAPVTIDWIHVGDAGNAADPLTGFGAVNRTYQISKFEVTVSQYIEFLNSNDPSGTNSLQLYTSSMVNYGINRDLAGPSGSYYFLYHPETANLPMNLVSWYDAIRFANWLNNGQVPGSTESGAYTLLGGTPIPSNWQSITRSPDAKIFLPSEDEWYKGAYYDPQSQSYYLYPTSSNTTPNASPPTATPNSLKYASHYSGFTPVGAYTGTTSPYGVFDMAGNVYEWSEGTNLNHQRIVRGGSASDPTAQQMKATARSWCDAFDQTSVIGFRVAAVPEPSTGVMAAIAVGMLWLVRGRLKK